MTEPEPSLAEIAEACGVEARTVRSWVAQGLLPAPLTRGPAARYPADTVERVLAIRAMRDLLGMPLAEIRKELLVASPAQISAHAARAEPLRAARPPLPSHAVQATQGASARDYISALRATAPAAPHKSRFFAPAAAAPAPSAAAGIAPAAPAQGFAALEHRLAQGSSEPARKARAETWLRLPVTPDVELAVRAPLDAEARARLERCADLIRDILLGRDR